jgi:tripartite ATP-independent transporter DctM subunit
MPFWMFSFVLLVILLLGNVPVFIALLGVTFLCALSAADVQGAIVIQQFVSGMQSVPLLAIPFFITAGVFMNSTGITRRLIHCCEACFGHLTGGLAQVNVVLSVLMGGLSGSNIADAAMQSKIIVPQMIRRGYSPAFSSAVTASSSLITPIIPPGIALIIFGFAGNVSIGRLFLAGVVPGLLLAILLMIVVARISRKHGYKPIHDKPNVKAILLSAKDACWALLMPIIIIGGIRFGAFTPTEAGSVAVLYALFLGFVVYREMTLSALRQGLSESVVTTVSILVIIAAASAFSWILTWMRVPQAIAATMLTRLDSPLSFLVFINLLFLFIGMFIEGNAAMLILVPIFMPIARQLGVNDVHFGIVTVLNMSIATVTPPMGTILFTTCAITKTDMGSLLKAMLPFYVVLFTMLALVTFLPWICLFLPRLIFGG